eukprot:COSAG01_NODE_17252_length_1166_cov_1.754452_1_plen_196_part_10
MDRPESLRRRCVHDFAPERLGVEDSAWVKTKAASRKLWPLATAAGSHWPQQAHPTWQSTSTSTTPHRINYTNYPIKMSLTSTETTPGTAAAAAFSGMGLGGGMPSQEVDDGTAAAAAAAARLEGEARRQQRASSAPVEHATPEGGPEPPFHILLSSPSSQPGSQQQRSSHGGSDRDQWPQRKICIAHCAFGFVLCS